MDLKRINKILSDNSIYSARAKKAILAISDEVKVKNNNNLLMLIDSLLRLDVNIADLTVLLRDPSSSPAPSPAPAPEIPNVPQMRT